jgi:hypothetical protein
MKGKKGTAQSKDIQKIVIPRIFADSKKYLIEEGSCHSKRIEKNKLYVSY